MLTIIDGPNWFRRRAERDNTGSPLRTCFREIQTTLIKGPVVIVWDGVNANARRRKLYPDYKLKRTPATESMYESQRLMKKLLTFTEAVSVEIPGYEGDDVIAAIADKYRHNTGIFIESNDKDLSQLGLPMAQPNLPTTPDRVVLYKTLVGDSSDNIKGVVGFGEGAWASLDKFQLDTLESIIISGHGLTAEEVDAKVSNWFPKKSLKWFCDPVNRKLLQVYYKIINFMPISWEEIEKNLKVGLNRPDLAEQIMREYML